MKNSLILLAAFIITGCSSTFQTNPTPAQQGSTSMEEARFEMDRKIKEARQNGLNEGIGIGFAKAKKVVKEYSDHIKRLEAGKYAIRKGFVTPPEIMVYQTLNGTLDYRATGCRIEKELDVNDIFKKFGGSVSLDTKEASEGSSTKSSKIDSGEDSYYIAERDTLRGSITRTTPELETVSRTIPSSEANRLVLDQYNIRYVEKEGNLIISFAGIDEMNGFCSQFKICGGN